MKKTATTFLFGMIFMVSAHAQTPNFKGLNGLVLDSTYTTSADGTRTFKSVFFYNSNKDLTSMESYDYDENMSAFLSTRAEITYQNDGYIESEIFYDKDEETGEFVMTSKYVFSEWNEINKEPGVSIIYVLDEDNPEAGLQPAGKQEIFFNDNGLPLDYHLYELNENDDWELAGKGHLEYNEDGVLVSDEGSMTMEVEGETYNYQTMTTYEYDGHGNVSKEITTTKMFGMVMGTTTIIYENEYYDDGNLKMIKSDTDRGYAEHEIEFEYYFWGNGNTTLIRSIEAAKKLAGIYFDLSGRRHQGTPTEKGIYIIEGRKVIVE
ncbi:MAG: hypothetical protein J6P66_07720 [Bacteroidaceae bacterium]|nr:hypothetical protein [Bacteroidaceae bacterium]